jgi:cell wall-associated NlpC family hydrolase
MVRYTYRINLHAKEELCVLPLPETKLSNIMKLNPMSPKIAAATILLAVTGATLTITPAQAAEDAMPAPVVQTINKYDVASFEAPVFESPKVVSWAVAYTPKLSNKTQLDPAEKALLADDAQLAQKQKTVVEKDAAIVRTEIKRIADEKAAIEKAAAEKAAAEKAAAEKAAADKLAAEVAAKAAAEQAEAERVAAEKVAIEAAAAAQARTLTLAAQSAYPSVGSKGSAVTEQPSSNIGAALVASAYGQIGIHQDCTAMVEKALRSVGKSVGDIAPNDFYRYGTVVTNPLPGDLMVSSGHVAIYVGNGMAISGGFEGLNTVLHPAKYLTGSTFVRVS